MPFSSSSSSSSTTTTSSFMNISGMHSLQQGAPPIHVVTSHSSTSSLDVASLERSPNTPTSFQSTHPSSSSSKRVQQWKAKWNETSERWKVKAHEKIKRVDEWTHSKGLAIGGGSSSSTSSSPNDPLPLFGIPLDLAIARTQLYPQLPVPAIVVRCIEFLDSTGLHDVGLYRIPGASTAVHQLKHEFEMHGDVDLLAIPSSTTATSPTYQPTRHPHVVATVLKHYLRELPCLFPPLPPELDTSTSSDPSSPLLFAAPMSTSLKHEEIGPLALSSQKTHLSSSSSVTTLTPSWETWIPLFFPTLPKPTQCVLLMVLTHLTRVAFFSDTNKMTASNLALIFSPTFHVPSSLLLYLLTHEEWYACSTLKN